MLREVTPFSMPKIPICERQFDDNRRRRGQNTVGTSWTMSALYDNGTSVSMPRQYAPGVSTKVRKSSLKNVRFVS
ncbi:MAG: hypothetical protein E7269_01540 [Lachnospiraceae bacterium]|nr:hypothetical protein [Lachnospiraceae bacterium]